MRFFTLLMAVMLFSVHTVSANNLTLDDLVKLRQVTAMAISPSGEHIAYLLSQPRELYSDDDGVAYNELYIANSDGDIRPFITGKVSLSQLQWGADSRQLYFIAKRFDDKQRAIWRIPVDGGEAQKVYQHSEDIRQFSVADNQESLLFVAREAEAESVKKLAKKGFKAEVVEEQLKPYHLWTLELGGETLKAEQLPIADNVVMAQLNAGGDRILLARSPSSRIDDTMMKASLQIVTREGKVTTEFKHAGKLGKALWSPNGKRVLFIGSASINDPSAGRLYLGNRGSEVIAELLPDYQGHVKDIAWLSDRQALYVGHEGTESVVGLINIDSGRISPLVEPGVAIFQRLATSDAGTIALIADSRQHPRELFVIARPGQSPNRLTISNPWLEEKQLATQEVFTYKARDGLDLQGILVKPLDYVEGERYPLIMFVHGGPEAHISNGWVSRYANPAQVAAAEGYVSFFPNYRGSTGRGVEFSMLGQGDYAGAEFNDLVDAKQALVDAGLADSKRVGITGGSYGGYASAWGATALSEHFAASVMFVGISDKISKFGTTDIPNEMYLVHARQWPWQDWQYLLERSPIYHAQKHHTPLLIMHGKDDTRVHPSQSMELYRYLKTLNQAPVRLVLYPGEGHGNRKAAAQYDYSLRLMRWMDFYLKGDGEGMPPYEIDYASQFEAAETPTLQ